jgi:hypothetical protein
MGAGGRDILIRGRRTGIRLSKEYPLISLISFPFPAEKGPFARHHKSMEN